MEKDEQVYFEKQLAFRSLPILDEPQGKYPYKFFEIPQAAQVLDMLIRAVVDKTLRRTELYAILTGKSESKARIICQDALIKLFVANNIIIANDIREYVVVEDAYNLYTNWSDEPVSCSAFSRKVKEIFGISIGYHVKRVGKKTARVWLNCRLKTNIPIGKQSKEEYSQDY
jgi:hypothetical protein